MNDGKGLEYQFGAFRVDPVRRRLLRAGRPVALTPKVFDTLLYLVQRPGVLLTKDELLGALWPDVVVEENNLGQSISKLRGMLGEARGEHRYIATVPGHGYRFVAVVTEVAAGDDDTSGKAARPTRDDVPASRWRQHARPAAAAGLLACVALLVAVIWTGWYPASRVTPIRSIAVLPFKPLVPDSGDPALEIGIADSLIARLSATRDLTVRPLGVVRRFRDPDQDPISAGRELGVEAVVEGHMHRAGDRIRMTVRLLRVADGKQLWAGQFDERFTDIFSVQDVISGKVTGELALELTGDERVRMARHDTSDAEAYDLYLKGRFFMDLAQPQRAIEAFEAAVQRDADFAAAHAGLADIYSRLPIATDGASREPIVKARASALRALELDDRLAAGHAALGWIRFYHDWDWRAAEASFRRALQLDPTAVSAHLGYAHLLSLTGRHDEALQEVDEALVIEPRSPIVGTLKGQFLFNARRYDEAAGQVQRTLGSAPAFWIALLHHGRIHQRAGRYEAALDAFSKARDVSGSWTPLAWIGFAHATAGQRTAAEEALAELAAASELTYVPPCHMAVVHQGLGDHSSALQWLERGYQERDVRMVFLGVDPAWDSLRADDRFIALLTRMNLPR
jgi:DNA-binding winged helix-turn-helix (wHTH) protein/TolB-like protein/Tfp pilus assembly protein PilF